MAQLAERTSSSGIARRRGQRLFYAAGLIILFVAGLVLAYQQVGQYQANLSDGLLAVNREGVPSVIVREIAPANATPSSPLVIMAHALNGNKETLLAMAVEVAKRDNARVYIFDLPGHNQAAARFRADSTEQLESANTAALDSVYAYARQKYPDAKIALLGHDMGAATALDFAASRPEIVATIALSPDRVIKDGEITPLTGDKLTTDNPRNLLVVVAENDLTQTFNSLNVLLPPTSLDQLKKGAYEGGSLESGSARRYRLVGGQNHLTVLYTADTQAEVVGWLDRNFNPGSDGANVRQATLNDQNGAGARLRWTYVGIIFSFCILFALASLLMDGLSLRAPPGQRGPRLSPDKHIIAVGVLVLLEIAALLIWTLIKPPPVIIGVQFGSWLAVFLLTVGLGVGGILWYLEWREHAAFGPRLTDYSYNWASVIGTRLLAWGVVPIVLALATYWTLGLFSNVTWVGLIFRPARFWPLLTLFICLLPYCLAIEYIFRRISLWGGWVAQIVANFGLMLILLVGTNFNPGLNSLIALIPFALVILFFLSFLSLWLHWLGRDFVTIGLYQAMVLAALLALVFPLV